MYPCTSRERRAAMSDGEFWQDVADSLSGPQPDADEDLVCMGIDAPTPCPECGSTTACGYDTEGRPMIHVTQEDE